MIDCTKSIDEAQNVLTNGGYNERYINVCILLKDEKLVDVNTMFE